MNNGFPSFVRKSLVNIALGLIIYFTVNYMITSKILNRYYSNLIDLVLIYIIAAVSLNLTCGYLGQLPLGHAGFMSIGAYTAAILTTSFQMPDVGPISGKTVLFFVSTVLGGLLSMLAGVLIGLPALRLKGDYLAIITLAFGEIIRVLIQNVKITGGAMGLGGIGRLTSFPWCFFWTIVTILFSVLMINSRHGRAIRAIKEDELAAESVGINVTKYKIYAFAFAAFFAGVSGSLFAHHICYLEPGNFGYNMSIELLVMVVLGGLGSVSGAVISATVLTVIPEILQTFASWKMIIYSILLIIVMIFKPSGLMGEKEVSVFQFINKVLKRSEPTFTLPEDYKRGAEK